MKLLVTGATGFVGNALVNSLAVGTRYALRASVRRADIHFPENVEVVTVNDLTLATDWAAALSGMDVVVHAAARVHIMNESSADPLAEFRRVNVDGTLHLARQAIKSGVRRFVFISSIKVNGEATVVGRPFTADDAPNPVDPYGISKHEAEIALQALAAESDLEIVIIRPVLVYGPGVKANFASMMRWLDKGIPLPLGALTANRRSMVALDNLVDLIKICLHHPAAANQVFLVSDGESLSTTALLRRTATALGKPARLIPVPTWLLTCGARMLGKSSIGQRLCGSLEVDIVKTSTLLGWQPPVDVDTALRQTVRSYQAPRSEGTSPL